MKAKLFSLLRLWRLKRTPLWGAALQAVRSVSTQRLLHEAAQKEPMLSFCPRCGQRPDGDRRMEEARILVIEQLGYTPKRSDLDFALAWHYWSSR